MMIVHAQLIDDAQRHSKDSISGQMSLFDLGDDLKKDFEIKIPNVGEYTKEELLEYEKEVLGIYASGHPLDEYAQMWKRRFGLCLYASTCICRRLDERLQTASRILPSHPY